jgi:hypothetical protein
MSILREGRLATYIGEGDDFGAQVEVLSLENRAAWGRFVTGARTGEIELIEDLDLTPAEPRSRYARLDPVVVPVSPVSAPVVVIAARDDLDDSLDVGLPLRVGVAQVQHTQGTLGVLTMLATRGDLQRLSTVVDEAFMVVANRIRQDPNVRTVIAQLDDEDAENLVQMASLTLLHSAFGEQRQ